MGIMINAVHENEYLYAVMKTSEGDIGLRLFCKDAPKTVENFVGLATGEKAWTNPATGKEESRPLYPGTVFHRVIAGFMIQGGDPLGRGTGGPGYRFEDEFQSGRKFDKPGLLAMANAGPGTNGSQFFITVVPTPHLNNRHTIFGEVVEGYEVVDKIANVLPKDSNDRPKTDVRIESIMLSVEEPKR
jgi:peptidyl-prolyl cis-trans isomerase A (cyclophilin A)